MEHFHLRIRIQRIKNYRKILFFSKQKNHADLCIISIFNNQLSVSRICGNVYVNIYTNCKVAINSLSFSKV